MQRPPGVNEGGGDPLPPLQHGTTRRATLAGLVAATVPVIPGPLAHTPESAAASFGLLIDANKVIIRADVDLVTISGFKAVGDAGAGREYVRDPSVTEDSVATDPKSSFLDASGVGFRLGGMSSAEGSSNVGFLHLGAGAVARSVRDKLRDTVSLKDFGAVGDGVANETAALFKARDHCAKTGARLVIPAGDYKYNASPNWAITNLEVVAHGRVRLYYSGTGDALIFDAGPNATDLCYGVRFCVGNPVHLYGKATTKNGVWARSVHHSHVSVNVHGCGSAYAGLYIQFAVCSVWEVVVSANEGGWFDGNQPGFGYKLDKRLAGESTSYCYFPNPIVERVGIGILLAATFGNLFIGGTSEGCSKFGIVVGVEAKWDRFVGTDLEVNTSGDIYCDGLGIEFISCDTEKQIIFGSSARRCLLSGGGHEHISLKSGSSGCTIVNVAFNRRETGGALVDNGSGTEILNARNGAPPYSQYLVATKILAPAMVDPARPLVESVRVPEARVGDFFVASCNIGMQGFQISCHCNAAGVVDVMFTNVLGTLAHRVACTVRVRGTRGL